MDIKIKYIRNIMPIEKKENGDWIDLRCAKDIKLRKGDYCEIPLGVAMELPHGCEAHILPRSSTYKRFKIVCVNSMGIIDESYCGDNDEWKFPVIALEDTTIMKNDRICQFRIMFKQPEIKFNIVHELANKNRGGLGSTGVK